jgi:hypothetical protein
MSELLIMEDPQHVNNAAGPVVEEREVRAGDLDPEHIAVPLGTGRRQHTTIPGALGREWQACFGLKWGCGWGGMEGAL